MSEQRSLSPREREVLQLIAEAYSTEQIAAILHLGPKTVQTYRRTLFQALGTHSAVATVTHAIRHKLVKLPGIAAV